MGNNSNAHLLVFIPVHRVPPATPRDGTAPGCNVTVRDQPEGVAGGSGTATPLFFALPPPYPAHGGLAMMGMGTLRVGCLIIRANKLINWIYPAALSPAGCATA